MQGQKYYENKQYKKGVKEADSILKKRPKDGETLCMKGLLVYHLDSKHRKNEALELCKRGLSHVSRSHVCWHVLGLIHRFEKEYLSAVKCYEEAIAREPDNWHILRDLCNMQVKIRNYPGLVHYRAYYLSRHKPTRQNFVGLATAHHLNGNAESALEVLHQFENTIDRDSLEQERFVHSELALYNASILSEIGQLDNALHHLDMNEKRIIDQRSVLEMRSSMLLQKNEVERAQDYAFRLVKMNPDDQTYHTMLLRSLDMADFSLLSDEDMQRLLRVYKGLQARFFRSHTAYRMPLSFLRGRRFEKELRRYIRSPLRKGVPSLSSDLRPLYADPQKANAIDAIINETVSSLKAHLCFPGGKSKSESPATLLWALLLKAENELSLRGPEEALRVADECIEHTPTALDSYVTKARALGELGAHSEAAEVSEEARTMDLADRNINGFSTVCLFRAGRIEEASRVAQLFSRSERSWGSIHDMQCLWFELNAGKAYRHSGDRPNALWQLDKVIHHFDDFEDDEFDFHQYCLRRMTLRRYVDMVRYVDRLRSHPYFVDAAETAVNLRLSLYDMPYSEAVKKQEEAELAHLSASQRKKQLKAKRQKQLQEGESEAEKVARADDQLTRATSLVEHLQQQAPERADAHSLAVGVYIRRQKMLLALKALRRLSAQCAMGILDSRAAPCAVAFLKCLRELEQKGSKLAATDTGEEVLREEVVDFVGERTEKQVLEELEQRASTVQDELALARCRLTLDPSAPCNVSQKLLTDCKERINACSLDDALDVLHEFKRVFDNKTLAAKWAEVAHERFPRSSDLREALNAQQSQNTSKAGADGTSQMPNGSAWLVGD